MKYFKTAFLHTTEVNLELSRTTTMDIFLQEWLTTERHLQLSQTTSIEDVRLGSKNASVKPLCHFLSVSYFLVE